MSQSAHLPHGLFGSVGVNGECVNATCEFLLQEFIDHAMSLDAGFAGKLF